MTAPQERQHALSQTLWQVGAPLILLPVLVFCSVTVLFIAGASLSGPAALLVLAIATAASLAVTQVLFQGNWRLNSLISVALIILAIFLSQLFHDTSIDGQHYHFQAIYALAHGWNPFWDTGPPPTIADPPALWVFHYPRSAWTFSATLLAAGFPFAATKVANFLFLFGGALVLSGALFRFGFSPISTLLLSGAAILNPIVLGQLYTGMNDGLLFFCIAIFTVSITCWVTKNDRNALLLGVAAMLFGLNLKFSGVLIFAVLCAFACLGWYVVAGWRPASRASVLLLAVAALSIVGLGWSPYVLNYFNFGHVFYPLMGAKAVDIMDGNTPAVLSGLSGIGRFFFSLFAHTHSGYETLSTLKVPFYLTSEEIRSSGGVDVRIGGFGPLFSGVLALATISSALQLVERPRTPTIWGLFFIGGALLVSVALMPQNWWARYVPHFWLVPWCVAAAAIAATSRSQHFLGWSIVIVMLLNAGIVAGAATWLVAKRSAAVTAQMREMKLDSRTYCVYPALAQSRLLLFQEWAIKADAVARAADLTCAAPSPIASYGPDRIGGLICACQPR